MKKLPSLNGLRAISIIIVIIFHLLCYNFRFNKHAVERIPVLNGGLGVTVFFVISGFLITSLLLVEEKENGKISIRNFYARRTLRIFPAYFFLLAVYAILQLSGYIYIPKTAWLTALTYTKYLNCRIEWYTSHGWSLSIEETFYLFWPLTFLLGDKIRKNVAITIFFLVPIVRSYFYYNPADWIDDKSLFTRIDAIATGCLIAIYKKEILSFITPYWSKAFYGSIILLFLIPWMAYYTDPDGIGFIFIPFGVLNGTFANVLIGLIIMYSVYGPKNSWHQVLNWRILNYIGILSYSLYLWQQFFIGRSQTMWVTRFPICIIFIFLAAIFSYYVVEKPFLKLKHKFSRNKVIHSASQKVKPIMVLNEKESG